MKSGENDDGRTKFGSSKMITQRRCLRIDHKDEGGKGRTEDKDGR